MKYHQMNKMKIYEKIHIWLFEFNNVCNHFPSLLHILQLALKSLKLYISVFVDLYFPWGGFWRRQRSFIFYDFLMVFSDLIKLH